MKFRKVKIKVESLGFYQVTPITAEKNYSEIVNENGEKFPITGYPPYQIDQPAENPPDKNDKQNP